MSSQRGPSSRLTRADILRAAYRHYELQETQSSIADDLGISTGYLARRLKEAREKGWVRFHVDVPVEAQRAADLRDRYPSLTEVAVVGGFEPTARRTVAPMSQVLAAWLNDMLEPGPDDDAHVGSIATGGGTLHQAMLDRVLPRHAPCDVGPTSLMPREGELPRWPPSAIATVLSFRLDSRSAGGERGQLFDMSIEPPPAEEAEARAWWRRTRRLSSYCRMQQFWDEVDVVFVAATTLDRLYPSHRAKVDVDELKERGVVGIAAGQFFDSDGRRVELAEAVPGLIPAMPLETIAEKATQRADGNPSRAVVMDVRGAQARAARFLIEAGLVTHLACDVDAATKLAGDMPD